MGHQRVQWLADSCAEQELDAGDIELVALEQMVDAGHAHERKQSSEGTILEKSAFVHGDELAAKVLSALFIERSVENAVRFRNVEGIRNQRVQ